MILPSEDDSRKPEKKPPGGGEGGDSSFSDAVSWGAPAEDDDDDGETWKHLPDDDDSQIFAEPHGGGDMEAVASPAPDGWRDELKNELLDCVDDLKEIEDPAQEFDPPEPPDLFTFFGELEALRMDWKHELQRHGEMLRQCGKALVEMKSQADVRRCALSLVALFDHFAKEQDGPMTQTVMSAMGGLGVSTVPTAGAKYDPASMAVAGTEKTTPARAGKVLREVEAGFMLGRELLRPARVIVGVKSSARSDA